MKKRKLALVSFLAAAALTCGIGYAAVSDTLDIQGTATVKQSDLDNSFADKVYFSAVEQTTDATKWTASINQDNNNKASFSIYSLVHKNDTQSIKYTIKNDSVHDATVSLTIPEGEAHNPQNNNPTYFEVSHDLGDGKTLIAGGTLDVTVTVKLIQDTTTTVSGSFGIEMVATAGNAVSGN